MYAGLKKPVCDGETYQGKQQKEAMTTSRSEGQGEGMLPEPTVVGVAVAVRRAF